MSAIENLKYGLKASLVAEMISEIARCEKVSKIVLFGSRAKGNFREGSDIDLALFGSELNTTDIAKISVTLDDAVFPYQLDLVIYDRITASELRNHINRVGIQLFKRH